MNKPCPCCHTVPTMEKYGCVCCLEIGCPLFGHSIPKEHWNKPRQPSEDQQELARTASEALTLLIERKAMNDVLSEVIKDLQSIIEEQRKEIQQLSKV